MDFYGNQQNSYDEEGVYVARAAGGQIFHPNDRGGGYDDSNKPQNMNARIN